MPQIQEIKSITIPTWLSQLFRPKHNKMKATIAQLGADVQDKDLKIAQLETDLDSSKSDMELLNKSHNELITRYKSELESFTELHSKAKVLSDELRARCDSAEGRIQEVYSEYDHVCKENSELSAVIYKLEEELKEELNEDREVTGFKLFRWPKMRGSK